MGQRCEDLLRAAGDDSVKVGRHEVWFPLVSVLLGLSVALGAIEVALRILRPDLAYAASRDLLHHEFRRIANPRNGRRPMRDPDTGARHLVIHNSLGLRQHREIGARTEDATLRIGVMGDSFTENQRVPAQFVFTEVLDHLLNQTGRRYEVLNLGTEGYGPDQSYLQFLDEGSALGLDVVVYMYFINDLQDLIRNKLFELGEDGELQYAPRRRAGLLVRLARPWYITYFVLPEIGTRRELQQLLWDFEPSRLEPGQGGIAARDARGERPPHAQFAYAIFDRVLERFSEEVRDSGARFFVVLTPNKDHEELRRHYENMASRFDSMGVPTLDLAAAFVQEGREGLFFENDLHWNAEGNKLAAVHLFKFLAEQLGVEYGGDEFVRAQLSKYYGAFPDDRISEHWLGGTAPSRREAEAIRGKYLGLEARADRED